jgi:hypothetical protein
MDESRIDLSALRPRADRMHAVVGAAMNRIGARCRESPRDRVRDQIRRWSWPVAAAASITAIAAGSILLMKSGSQASRGGAWEDVLATSVGIPPALAEWSVDRSLPTTAELLDALWGGPRDGGGIP